MAIFDDNSVGGIIGKFDNTKTPTNGQVLKYNSTSSKWEPGTDESGGAAVAAGSQTWTTPGTYSWICPSGVTAIAIHMIGGGGSGCMGGGGTPVSGGGGGGGVYINDSLAVVPGTSYSVIVGAGGASLPGTITTGTPGRSGGASSFGPLCYAGGGGGGVTSGAGAAGGGYTTSGAGSYGFTGGTGGAPLDGGSGGTGGGAGGSPYSSGGSATAKYGGGGGGGPGPNAGNGGSGGPSGGRGGNGSSGNYIGGSGGSYGGGGAAGMPTVEPWPGASGAGGGGIVAISWGG